MMPAFSLANKSTTTFGGLCKIWKSELNSAPILANLSAQLLASLNTCTTRELENFFIRFLQSVKRGSSIRLTTKGFDTRYTRNSASISVQMFSIPNYLATLRPSLKSHSSATVLVMFLSFLANPAIQSPLLHLRIPPPPALIGSPNINPFVFSFTYPIGGLIHFTWI